VVHPVVRAMEPCVHVMDPKAPVWMCMFHRGDGHLPCDLGVGCPWYFTHRGVAS